LATSETPIALQKTETGDVVHLAPEQVVHLVPGKIDDKPEREWVSRKTQADVAKGKFPFGYIVWTLVFVLAAVGWSYHEKWWPSVAPYLGLEKKEVTKPVRIIPVVTATVEKKDMEVFINGLGTVTAFKTVTIRSRVEGELVNVAFTEGQMVEENDLLAEIDKRQFEVMLEQAEGTLLRDEATLKTAESTLRRYQELTEKKSIAAQQVDDQRALVAQTRGAIKSDHAMVSNAKLQLIYCHITAPISGRIGLRLVDKGNIVRANDLTGLAVITQLQPIAVYFTVPQDDISRVQKATLDGHELTVIAYDRNFTTKLATGKLLAIDNQVDVTTGTVRLKAVFDNDDGLLFPNQFVNARLLVDTRKDAIVVPTAAVQRGPNFTFVYVVQPDEEVDKEGNKLEKVDLRIVTTGLAEGALTAVTSGLEPGEIVVTDGLDKLQKNSKVSTGSKEKESGKKSDSSDKSPTAKSESGEQLAKSTKSPEKPVKPVEQPARRTDQSEKPADQSAKKDSQ